MSSKWAKEFEEQFKTRGRVKKLTEELKNRKVIKQADDDISNVLGKLKGRKAKEEIDKFLYKKQLRRGY